MKQPGHIGPKEETLAITNVERFMSDPVIHSEK